MWPFGWLRRNRRWDHLPRALRPSQSGMDECHRLLDAASGSDAYFIASMRYAVDSGFDKPESLAKSLQLLTEWSRLK